MYQLRRDGGVRVHTTGCHMRGTNGTWRPRYCPGSALPPRDASPAGERQQGTGAATDDAHHHDRIEATAADLERAVRAVRDLIDRGGGPRSDTGLGPAGTSRGACDNDDHERDR